MRVLSAPSVAQPERSCVCRRHHTQRALLITLGLLCVPALSFACAGGLKGKSPENPSVVLALIGGAAVGWKSVIARIRK